MAKIEIRFYAELNDFLPRGQRYRDVPMELSGPAPLVHLIESLGIPHTEVELALVNGESVGPGYQPKHGDRVSVFPMFESFDVTELLRFRERPLRVPRFIVDAHLGKLARYLRMLGFDTVFSNDIGDRRLAETSVSDGRTLLTRDRALLMRKQVTHGCFIRANRPLDQLREVVDRLDLCGALRPFSLCMECNRPLEPVDRAQVLGDLPPRAAAAFSEFWRCAGCGRLYWRGSHYLRMRDIIESLRCFNHRPTRDASEKPRSDRIQPPVADGRNGKQQ